MRDSYSPKQSSGWPCRILHLSAFIDHSLYCPAIVQLLSWRQGNFQVCLEYLIALVTGPLFLTLSK